MGRVIEDRNANTPAQLNQIKKKEEVAPLCGGGGAEGNRSSDIGIKSDKYVITHRSKL